MAGVFAFPALLPVFFAEWRLSNTEAGWIAGIYFGAYAVSVPVLVALTDRIDARVVYIGGAVLAAEKCTARIIHPGTPLNPKEKNLEKWLKRAEPFS